MSEAPWFCSNRSHSCPAAALGAGPEAWNTLERVSYVWYKNRWVAYPFQNNISALDKDDQVGGSHALLGDI